MKTKSLLGDLDKDGRMSDYEQARQDAIEENMRNSKRNGGSLLDDDMNRMGYANGTDDGPVGPIRSADMLINKLNNILDKGSKEDMQEANVFRQRLLDKKDLSPEQEIDRQVIERRFLEREIPLRKEVAEGGDIDAMLVISEPVEEQDDLVPDEEMEEDYLDFILDEALSEEEEEMLNDKLEQDEQLALLFDKVIDVAQEFAGAGLVEGPGNGISDSIPARLSDGEFVFTAKAVEEIGADELMRMMKDAEMRADERQGLANGGEPLIEEEERVVMPVNSESVKQDIRVRKETVGQPSSRKEEEDLVEDLRARRMMSGKSSVVS